MDDGRLRRLDPGRRPAAVPPGTDLRGPPAALAPARRATRLQLEAQPTRREGNAVVQGTGERALPAPIALDFAVPVSYAEYDSQQLFSFFVGFAR